MYVCTNLGRTYVRVCACMHACRYIFMYMHVYMYVRAYAHMHARTRAGGVCLFCSTKLSVTIVRSTHQAALQFRLCCRPTSASRPTPRSTRSLASFLQAKSITHTLLEGRSDDYLKGNKNTHCLNRYYNICCNVVPCPLSQKQ